MRSDRLLRLPRLPLPPPLDAREARVASTPLARLRGLAFLDAGARCALLLPRTRSVHTFGMRFALDLVWVDRAGRALRIDRGVRPRRLRSCRTAAAVLELPSGAAAALTPGSRVL